MWTTQHTIIIEHRYPDLIEVKAEIEKLRDLMIRNQEKLMDTLDKILDDVTEESSRLDSLGVLIAGLRQQVADALSGVTLPPAVQAKVDAIFSATEANKAKIDKALNANVPPPATAPQPGG